MSGERVTELDAQQALSMIHWYRRCLEDVQDGRVVRGLGEAKAGYDTASIFLAVEVERLRKAEAAAKEIVEILGRPDLYDAEELAAHVSDLRGYLDD